MSKDTIWYGRTVGEWDFVRYDWNGILQKKREKLFSAATEIVKREHLKSKRKMQLTGKSKEKNKIIEIYG